MQWRPPPRRRFHALIVGTQVGPDDENGTTKCASSRQRKQMEDENGIFVLREMNGG